jgi:hypothetical protein
MPNLIERFFVDHDEAHPPGNLTSAAAPRHVIYDHQALKTSSLAGRGLDLLDHVQDGT